MKILKLISVCSRLSSLNRFSMERLSCSESVLEHTGFVAIVAMAMSCELNSLAENNVQRLNPGIAVQKAIAHDMDELVTGDIARPTKYSTPKAVELFDELKSTSMEKVSKMLCDWPSFTEQLQLQHHTAKEGREGFVVRLTDALAVVYKVWQEVILRSNLSMTRQAFTVRGQLWFLRGKVDEHFSGKQAEFLYKIIDEAHSISSEAASRDEPILCTVREDT